MKNARFVSILLALMTLAGAALLREYRLEQDRARHAAAAFAEPAPAGAPFPLPGASPAPAPEGHLNAPADGRAIHKCVDGEGRTEYSHAPCPAHAASIEFAPRDSAGLAPRKPYQRQLAELEAQKPPAAKVMAIAAPQKAAAPAFDKAAQCQQLDQEIRYADSVLRAPHDAWTGDYWTEKRRQANNRKFDLHC